MRLYELKTKVKHTISPEYTAIRNVAAWMIRNQVSSISWRNFQKQFQQIGQKYTSLITTIRKNSPDIKLADLNDWLKNYKNPDKYNVSYGSYNDPETSYRKVKQVVMHINQSANATNIIKKDRHLYKYLEMVATSSAQSGHPVGKNTVGWIRIDEINKDWILIDEVQSDLINSVMQAKSILLSDSYEDFANSLPEKGREMLYDKVSPEQFNMAKMMIPMQGYTIEKLDEIKKQLSSLFKDWAEEALSSVIEVARQNNIKNIALHTAESIGVRDPLVSTETNKIKMFYDNLARSFGFAQEKVNHPNFSGTFWVKHLD